MHEFPPRPDPDRPRALGRQRTRRLSGWRAARRFEHESVQAGFLSASDPCDNSWATSGWGKKGAALRWGAHREAPARKDRRRGVGRVDHCEDPHRSAAARTLEGVDREDAFHQLCPREPPRPGGVRLGRCVGVGERDGRWSREQLALAHRTEQFDRGGVRRRQGRCARTIAIDPCRCGIGFGVRR